MLYVYLLQCTTGTSRKLGGILIGIMFMRGRLVEKLELDAEPTGTSRTAALEKQLHCSALTINL